MRELGVTGAPPLATALPESVTAAVRGWLAAPGLAPGHYLAMAPGASYGPSKCGPMERYIALARAVRERHGWPALLVGAPAERERLDAIAAAAGEGVVIFDRPALLEATAALGQGAVVVANDTGALHLARLAGVPVVGLFLSTSPEWTGPSPFEGVALAADVRCRPCFRRECPLTSGRYACLDAIPVERVLEAVDLALERPRAVAR